jgi:hypothetical protein
MTTTDPKPFRPVHVSASLATNYFYHLLAVARVAYDSEYADHYARAVSNDDIAFLASHRSLLSFGAGAAGPLCDVIYGLPLTLQLSSIAEVREYYHILDQALVSSDFSILSRQFDLAPGRFYPFFIMDAADFDLLREYQPSIQALGAIVLRNWASYEADVWPEVHTAILTVARSIEAAFLDRDAVGAWEKLTGSVFSRPCFSIELASAMKGGPNANSLGYGRVVFWSGTALEWMCDFISHEIGIHLIFPAYRELLLSGNQDSRILYHANECLAMYLNQRLLGRPVKYQFREEFHVDEYLSSYHLQLEANPNLHAGELLLAALNVVGK